MGRKVWLFVSLLWLPLGASAATIALTPVADADVFYSSFSGGSTSNTGTHGSFRVGGGGYNSTRSLAYLKYDLSSVSDPISTAMLSLTVAANYDGITKLSVRGLNEGDPGEAWGETSIVWGNAPGTNYNNTTLLEEKFGVNSYDVGGVLTFQSSQIVDFLKEDANNTVTFILSSYWNLNAYYTSFYAKENGDPNLAPTLTITTVPLPPAAILFVSAMGVMVLIGQGKRRNQRGFLT